MAKKFTITGNCVSHLHYMADNSAKKNTPQNR